jgi:transcriptional regulator with XRE-family HTH domain
MIKSKKKIKFIVEKTASGFSGYSKEYPVFTTGKNFTELLTHATEAMNLFFEDQDVQLSAGEIEFEIDLQQFFQYYRVINAKFLAERIGMNESLLSQYVQGKKKPSHKQTDKILHGIREIGRELANINLFT